MNKQLVENFLGKFGTFGPYIPLSNVVLTRWGRKMPTSWADYLFESRYKKIMSRLEKIVGPLDLEFQTPTRNDGPLWGIWLQGEENMPKVVRLCVESQRRFVTDRPVNIITYKNMHHYLDLGGRIMDLHRKGRIDFIHFADLIRIRLLATHGGMWADGTILLTSPLPEWWFDREFSSVKTLPSGRYVSRNRWTGFCMAASKGSAVPAAVDEIFRRYWNSQDWRIDYFLIDACINLAYELVPAAKAAIDAVPYNNPQLYAMRDMLAQPFERTAFEQITSDTSIFKLNWRLSNDPFLENQDSLFSHLKRMMEK